MRYLSKHPIYRSYIYTIFINKLIKKGNKEYSEYILKKIFLLLYNKINIFPLIILEDSIKKLQLPFKYIYNLKNKYFIISNLKSIKLVINWILISLKFKYNISFFKILFYEILKIYSNKSILIIKKLKYIKKSISCILYQFKLNKKNLNIVKFKKFNRKFFFEKKILFRLVYLNYKLNYIKSFY